MLVVLQRRRGIVVQVAYEEEGEGMVRSLVCETCMDALENMPEVVEQHLYT